LGGKACGDRGGDHGKQAKSSSFVSTDTHHIAPKIPEKLEMLLHNCLTD
jgi:hypothetical protein